jgi:hypothetical protein
MTGRENFRRAIEFGSPDYVPTDMYVNFDYIWDKDEAETERINDLLTRFPDDLIGFMWVWLDKWEKVDGITYKHDEWGTEWVDDGNGLVTCGYPFSDGYEKMESHVFPDPGNLSRFARADKIISEKPDLYKNGTVWFTLFERLWMMRNMENLFMDPYVYPAEFLWLKDKIMDINMAVLDEWCKKDIDGVYFSDDWGGQNTMLISPNDFRKYYYNDYKRMFRKVRDSGKNVWLHSCGNVTDIIPDFIDLGVNVLNPVQPQAMDVQRLAREFGGKICFNGGIDVQGTMIHGNPEEIRRELHMLIDLFGKYNGGYIVNTSHSIMPETPLSNVTVLFEEYPKTIGR